MLPNNNINIPYSSFINPVTGRPNQEWLLWLMNPSFVTLNLGSALPVASGGTGLTAIPTNGQLLIGNGTGYTLNTLTAGNYVSVANGAGTVKVTWENILPIGVDTSELTKQIEAVELKASDLLSQIAEMKKQLDAISATPIPELSGAYVPYRGAIDDVDLNNKHLVNVSHLGVGWDSSPNILGRFVGDNGSLSRVAMRGYSADALGSSIRVTKFRGTTTAPQVPQSGDSLGKFEFAGYATTSADGLAGAYWESVTTEMWGATAHGTKSLLYVTPNTTTTPVVAITVGQDKSVALTGSLSLTVPVTKSADFTVGATDVWLINNKAGSTCTVTLPAAASWLGRILKIQNYQAYTVVSASSNVVPRVGGAAGSDILAAVAGDTCTLVSDGSNWIMTQYTPNNCLLLE